jgi:DNA-binding MarR family transcriptional regulator
MVESAEKTSHETDRVKKPRKKWLTLNQARIIRFLERRDSVDEKELRSATGIDPSALSRTISQLQKHKLIVRNIQEKDARQRVLSATEMGRQELGVWENMLGLPAARKRRKRGSPGQSPISFVPPDPESTTVD